MAATDVSLKNTALRTWVAVLVITANLLFLLFLFAIRTVLLQLIIAVIFAIALRPFVHFLIRHGFKRAVASIVALIATIIILFGLIGAIASPLITQGGDLVDSVPRLISNATRTPVLQNLDTKYNIIAKGKDVAKDIPKLISGNGTPVLGAVSSVFSAVSSFFVIMILALFMLIEGPTAWNQFIRLLGKKQGQFVNHVSKKIMVAVGGFVNGNLLISLIAGVFSLIVLLLLRVPYAFALAALVAIFDLIPLVGAAIATIVIALVALTKGVIISLLAVILMLLYQFIEGNVIQPVVYGKTVKLSQLLIIVATIIGALLGGIIGVLLAIPIAAAIQIVIVELLRANGADLDPEVSASVKDSASK